MELTQAYIKSILDYDQETGVLTHKPRSADWFPSLRAFHIWDRRFARQTAGTLNYGYIQLRIKGKTYKAHRVIFLWMTGNMPPHHVDHLNGLPGDNRWCNLAAATRAENMKNMKRKSNNNSGVTGVRWVKDSTAWSAFIWSGGRNVWLGHHKTIFDAAAARISKQNKLGFSERHGR